MAEDEAAICHALRGADITCAQIGVVREKKASADAVTVYRQTEAGQKPLPFPEQDAITAVFATAPPDDAPPGNAN